MSQRTPKTVFNYTRPNFRRIFPERPITQPERPVGYRRGIDEIVNKGNGVHRSHCVRHVSPTAATAWCGHPDFLPLFGIDGGRVNLVKINVQNVRHSLAGSCLAVERVYILVFPARIP